MADYCLAILGEDGARVEIPLELGTLGYPHVVLLDEDGLEVEVANDPPEAPPVGRFPYLREDGTPAWIEFEPVGGTVDDGGVVLLAGPLVRTQTFARDRRVPELAREVLLVGLILRTLDFARRNPLAQLGDTLRVAIDLRDDLQVPDLSGATTLEIVLWRADGSALVRNATESNTVPGRVEVQLQAGDVQSAGTWRAQAHVAFGDGTEFWSRPRAFEVLHNLPTT